MPHDKALYKFTLLHFTFLCPVLMKLGMWVDLHQLYAITKLD